MKRVPIKHEGKEVGWADVDNGIIIKAVLTDPSSFRWLTEDDLQYISLEDK